MQADPDDSSRISDPPSLPLTALVPLHLLPAHARTSSSTPPPFELDVIHSPLTYWPQAGDAHNYTDALAALLRRCRLRTAECTSRCGTVRCGLSAALIASSHFIDINSSPFSVPQTINRTPFTTTTAYSRATPPRRYSSLSSPNNNKSRHQPESRSTVPTASCVPVLGRLYLRYRRIDKGRSSLCARGGGCKRGRSNRPKRSMPPLWRSRVGTEIRPARPCVGLSRKIVLYSSCLTGECLRSPRQTMEFLLKAPKNSII